MRRLITIFIWLAVAVLTCGLIWGMTLGWRPAEFEDIYSLRPEVRLEWARDYERVIREQFISNVEKGEPFTLHLSQNAVNGLLAGPLSDGLARHLRTRIGLREPQVSLREGRIIFMTRSRQAGDAIVTAEIRVRVPDPGRCVASISGVRIGSVPLDDGFLADKADTLETIAERQAAAAERILSRNRRGATFYQRRAAFYRFLAALVRGEPVAARGEVGEGLFFRVDRVEIGAGRLRLGIIPGPLEDSDGSSSADRTANTG